MIAVQLIDKANGLGLEAAVDYSAEFDDFPVKAHAKEDGKWIATAWGLDWLILMIAGATLADYDACYEAWKIGFWGIDDSPIPDTD